MQILVSRKRIFLTNSLLSSNPIKPKHNDSQRPTNPPNATNIPRYSKPPSFLPSFLPTHTSNHIPSRKNPPPLIHPSINQAPHPTYSNTLRTRTIKQTNPQTPQKPLLVSDKSRTRSDYPLLYTAPKNHPYPKKGGLLYLPHRRRRSRYSSRYGYWLLSYDKSSRFWRSDNPQL